MNVRCFHCGHAVPITAEQLGGEVICPSCGGKVRLPEAEDYQPDQDHESGKATGSWISNSVSGLVSLVLHMGLLLAFAMVTCDFRGGGGGEGEEVLIGELPTLDLNEQSDESLDAEAADASADAEAESLTDSLEVIVPLETNAGNFSLDLEMSQFSPSGGASGGSPAISALSGGGGSLGQGASFMGLHAKGTRFCIIADCSGSMEGPKLQHVKEEVLETLSTMSTRARFQLIFFNSRAIPFPESGWRHPRRDRAEVASWLQTLSAGGGTNPTPAFREAFQLSPPPDAIFFMTDGLFEDQVVGEVAVLNQRSGRKVQINTISFMDTSSEQLMRAIAQNSGGRYRHVAGF
jgi:hypothetical protein